MNGANDNHASTGDKNGNNKNSHTATAMRDLSCAPSRDPSIPFGIAAAQGALDAGCWVIAATLCAALAGEWLAACGMSAPLARALLAGISTLSGLAALWYAVRIHIDRRLFVALADAFQPPRQTGVGNAGSVENPQTNDPLARLDDALAQPGWPGAAKASRPLSERVWGTVGLLRKIFAVAVVQWLVVGVAIALRGF